MNDGMILIFSLVVLLFSAIIHEVSHGVVADRLGDGTARLAGRLTLNPLAHLDPVGSVLVPLFLALANLPIFGWAKPVPYDPRNLKNPKMAAGQIALAGPGSNLILAAIFGLLLRGVVLSGASSLGALTIFFSIIVYINILLAVFNLVPIPPLDGSKVLFALLPTNSATYGLMHFLNQYGIYLVLFFIFFGFQLIIPLISFLAFLFTGQTF